MPTIMTWMSPTLDVVAVALLAVVLWRLGREPGTAWNEREARLQAIFEELRGLVAQSEGLARDLDARLAVREERFNALVAEGRAVAEAAKALAPVELNEEWPADAPRMETKAQAASELDSTALAARIEALAEAGRTVEEIARRLGAPAAEVRLVIGLKAARAARMRAGVARQERAHA